MAELWALQLAVRPELHSEPGSIYRRSAHSTAPENFFLSIQLRDDYEPAASQDRATSPFLTPITSGE